MRGNYAFAWRDDDDVTAAGCALLPSGEQRSPASGVEVENGPKAGRGDTPARAWADACEWCKGYEHADACTCGGYTR